MEKKYMVGIRCATYNQSQYIRQTLDGFTCQRTDFPYIAMVTDDASTDGTPSVIESYLEEHFDIKDISVSYSRDTEYAHVIYSRHKTNPNCHIVVLLLNENHYQKGLHYKKLEYLTEWKQNIRYEAICEGDDYWTDPYKLQKQVDLMESHPEFSACCSNIYTLTGDVLKKGEDKSGIIYFKDLMNKNRINTLSSMSRADLTMEYYKTVYREMPIFKMGDYPLWLFLAQHGPICRMKEYMGVYRILENSASHFQDFMKQYDFMVETARIKLWFNKRYSLHYKPLILIKLASRTRKMCRKAAKRGEGKYFSLLIKTLKHLHKTGLKR